MTATVADAELVTAAQFAEARERLHGAVLHTPLVRLTSVTDAVSYLKPESLQPIGSFKLRGAYNALAQLSEAARRRGVITYSSGNHGQGVAYAARAFGIPAVIVMPSNAPQIKRD
ncbi:MAG TPA: pyridoxal-phosphate dependent enzyme, partial [Acidobacteriaceae bacterium]|nr:pyridoxal-phosphate dependent enzyme [Acidobacteriaceae bacterium]